MRSILGIHLFFIILILTGCGSDFDLNQKTDKLFTRIPADYSGLIFNNEVRQTRENNHLINIEFISGGGVAVGDINKDGLEDVYFTGNQVSDKLFLNKGNFKFQDISGKAGIGTDDGWSTGVTFIDIDNDGDQDIYVCRCIYLENEKSANLLYINNGDLTFTEQAGLFGLADQGFATQATFCDFDKDGLIDMYLVNQPPSIPTLRGRISSADFPDIRFSDRLYKNMGNGKFTDVTERANVRNFAFGWSATVGDFNNDTWQDIYVTNDFDVADHMYINQQDGTFVDVIHLTTKHITHFSMGSDAADYDNDGNLDILVVDMVPEDHKGQMTHMTNINTDEFWSAANQGKHYQHMANTLMRNNGNGTFSDIARLAGIDRTDWSWGPLFADFDNDGYKDIFITNGVLSNNLNSDLAELYERKLDSLRYVAERRNIDPKQLIDVMLFAGLAATDKFPNNIYKNNGDHTFSKKVVDWGMEFSTISHGAAYADFDRDGDLDLIVNNENEIASLYKNSAIENGFGNYIRFKLNPSGGQHIYGTKVIIYKNDKLWQCQQIINSRGYRSKSEDMVHFGVGEVTMVDKVVIEWQDNTKNTLENVTTNKVYEISQADGKPLELTNNEHEEHLMFSEVTQLLGLSHVRHVENNYNDYSRQVLLPYKMSHSGPCLEIGDVNGDHKEDFFIGGSAGFSGTLFIQNNTEGFDEIRDGAWTQDKASEDTDVAFVDVENDGDLDMIITSGGYEFDQEDTELFDRLYINNGHGRFTKSAKGMPGYLTSSSCVIPGDYDHDGDVDLFVGGRLVPGKYPHPATSHLLENRGGTYVDVTEVKAPELINLGMVTDAGWTDYNMDGRHDLIIVGEWMPILIFNQLEDGTFKKMIMNGLENSEGWYFELEIHDMDGDGDDDVIAGNLGLNFSYRATEREPFQVFSDDFDRNGLVDIVFSYYRQGVLYPVSGRESSIKQIPALGKRYDTFEKFGNATLMEIYGESLNNALHLKAKTFSSAYLENLGDDNFSYKPLPALAQVSSMNGILVKDYDKDGYKDLLISGNLLHVGIENPRNDAGMGLLLKGNGTGDFLPVPITSSGFFTPFDAKDMKSINVGGREIILVANNNYFLQAIEYVPPGNNR